MAGRFSVEAVFKGIDQLSAPVRRMSKTMGRFTRSATRGLRNVNRALLAVGKGMAKGLARGAALGAVAVAALTVALKGVANEADALAKQSRRLEFPIEELQQWQIVAEQSGVGAENFGKGMEKLAKGIGEARAGTGTMITLLKKTNPALLKQLLNTKNVSEATDIYIKAIADAPDAMDKAALATAAFGRQGSKFINIAELGADAIEKLKQEQIENGIITRQQAEAAEAFNDAMSSAKRALMGFLQQALLPMMPVLTDLIKQFRAWTIANREIVSGKVLDFFKFVVNNFDDIIDRLALIGKAIGVFVVFTTVISTLTGVLTLFNLVAAANPIGLIVISVLGLIALFTVLVVWIDDIIAGFDKMPKIVQLILSPFKLVLNVIKFIKDNFDSIIKKASAFANVLGKLTGFSFGSEDIGDKNPSAQADESVPKQDDFTALTSGAINPLKVDDNINIVDIAQARMRRDEDEAAALPEATAQLVTREERFATQVNEQRTTASAELVIRDETGRGELTSETTPGIGIKLDETGSL